jgi:hypothetical protein
VDNCATAIFSHNALLDDELGVGSLQVLLHRVPSGGTHEPDEDGEASSTMPPELELATQIKINANTWKF